MYGKIARFAPLSKLLAGLVAWLAWMPAAFAVEMAPNPPATYVVVRGDTLWDIAGRFLRNPWEWPEIWQVNPTIENPHLIYPGDVLTLSYINGEPRLSLSRDGRVAMGGRLVKLTPTVREYGRDNAIPPIPLDAIQQFLSRPLVLGEDTLDASPYVLANEEDHVVGGVGSRIYIRGLGEPDSLKYSIYRPAGEFRDPDSNNELLGYGALHIGDVKLERTGDPATAYVIGSDREIRKGDRVLPVEEAELPEFIPRAPEAAVDGSIISVVDGVSQIGQFMVVALNRGRDHGVEPGHVLAIWQRGDVVDDRYGAEIKRREARKKPVQVDHMDESATASFLSHLFTDIRDTKYDFDDLIGEKPAYGGTPVQLPEERAGELLVFRSFDRVSFALIMNTQRQVHVLDRVRNP